MPKLTAESSAYISPILAALQFFSGLSKLDSLKSVGHSASANKLRTHL
jgi:hypothetical protein